MTKFIINKRLKISNYIQELNIVYDRVFRFPMLTRQIGNMVLWGIFLSLLWAYISNEKIVPWVVGMSTSVVSSDKMHQNRKDFGIVFVVK